MTLKQIFTNENRILAMNSKNILENAGITVQIKNEYGSDGATLGNQAWLELWVKDSDFQQAKELLAAVENTFETEWICDSCQEKNTSGFKICWKCQQALLA